MNSQAQPGTEAPATSRPAPDSSVMRGREPFVLRFDQGSAELDAETIRTIEAAVASYWETGFAWLRFADRLDPSSASTPSELSRRRARAVRDYLKEKHVWSVPVRREGGEWRVMSSNQAAREAIGGVALMGPTAAPALDPGLPPPPSLPVAVTPRVLTTAAPRIVARATAAPAPSALAAISSWLTPTGTLTAKALQALIGACTRLEGELTGECQAAATGGEGEFAAVPEDARAEFSLLLAGCRTLRQGRTCAEAVALEREFRALPRGRLDPQPLKMQEDVKTTFIARIVYDGDRSGGGRPGVPIGESPPPGGSGAGQATVVPFSGRMCFTLTADPADFRIRQLGEPCPEINEGGGRVKYDPQWEVTPLRAGRLELRLKTELYVNETKREFRHEPYPLMIEVAPKPSLWDGLDATIKRATATVNLAVGLAEALGLLFAAIAGWGIWAFLRKRKRGGAAEPPAA